MSIVKSEYGTMPSGDAVYAYTIDNGNGLSAAMTIETQSFPNAMSLSHYPGPVLKKGEEYKQTTVYRFV